MKGEDLCGRAVTGIGLRSEERKRMDGMEKEMLKPDQKREKNYPGKKKARKTKFTSTPS